MLKAVSLDAVREARSRLAGIAIRTPIIRLDLPDLPFELYLKLENLQPIGSFKLRGAANAMGIAGVEALKNGVYTASGGNMAQGVAWCARARGVRCQVIVPDRAAKTKIEAIARLGGEIIKVPFDAWWQTMMDHRYPGIDGVFVHPFADSGVMAGNGTIALEILEDVPDVDTILVPFGGGGLCCGIAAAARAVKPSVQVYAVEVDTAAPLRASLAQGSPATVTPTPSFVEGMGGKSVSAEIWPLAQQLLAGTLVVSVPHIAQAIRLLVDRCRIVAEAAGAAPVAAALDAAASGTLRARRVVCVVSGGNIDTEKLITILGGELP